jgi:hypothetical protein
LVTSCIGIAVWNTLLNKGWKWREEEEENVSSYWMTLRKPEKLEINGGSTESYCLENSFWTGQWTCSKTDYVVKMRGNISSTLLLHTAVNFSEK